MALNSSSTFALLDKECERLAEKLWRKYEESTSHERLLIGIAGIPGSGKSTAAQVVVQHLNRFHRERSAACTDSDFAVDLPMDGFHYTRARLGEMPEPEVAAHRRGAAFTFDADAFFAFIQELRQAPENGLSVVYAPSFDHAVKDPVQDDIAIPSTTKVVVIEGNYCALDRAPWSSAAQLMDEIWFLDVDRETVRERLAQRHVRTNVCADLDGAHERIRSTDFLNADDIIDNMVQIQEIIKV